MLIAILVVASLLLLTGIHWGLPVAVRPETTAPWGSDEVGPLEPLAEAYSLFTRSGVEFPYYPLFHYVVLAFCYAPYMIFLFLSGNLVPAPSYPYGLQDPVATLQVLVIIARTVSCLMAVGVVCLVYDLARMFWGRAAALWAAAMTAVVPLFVYYGKVSNLDIPYLFWLLLATRHLARILFQSGGIRSYVLFGVFSSLAVCTKDQAIGYLALYPLLLVLFRFRGSRSHRMYRRLADSLLGREMIVGLGMAILTFALANNLLFGFDGFVRHIQLAWETASDYRAFPPDMAGQISLLAACLLHIKLNLGPAILLVILGFAICVWEKNGMVLALLLLPTVGHHAMILSRVGYAHPHFLIPTLVFLIVLGAKTVPFFRRRSSRLLIGLVAVASLCYGLAFSLDMDYCLLKDARYKAEGWIHEHVKEGSVFEAYTPNARVLPRVWNRHNVFVLADPEMRDRKLQARNPDYILLVDVWFCHTRLDEAADEFVGNLQAGALGYETLVDFTTPTLFSMPVRMIPFIAPNVKILGRRSP